MPNAPHTPPLTGQGVYRPDRAAGAEKLLHAARKLADRYRLGISAEQGPYCLEVTLSGMGGAYPTTFLREFTALLGLADRFSIFPARGGVNAVLFTLEYDTHDYYFAGTKYSEG